MENPAILAMKAGKQRVEKKTANRRSKEIGNWKRRAMKEFTKQMQMCSIKPHLE